MDANNIIVGIDAICAEGGAFHVTRFVPSEQWQAALYHPEIVPNHLLLIAEWNNQFAGSIRLFPGEAHTLYSHVADLGLFVLKPHRRLGIGFRLMEEALVWAGENQVEKITLSVFATNTPAIRLYQKFGFKKEGRLMRQIKLGHEYIDFLQLALFL